MAVSIDLCSQRAGKHISGTSSMIIKVNRRERVASIENKHCAAKLLIVPISFSQKVPYLAAILPAPSRRPACPFTQRWMWPLNVASLCIFYSIFPSTLWLSIFHFSAAIVVCRPFLSAWLRSQQTNVKHTLLPIDCNAFDIVAPFIRSWKGMQYARLTTLEKMCYLLAVA